MLLNYSLEGVLGYYAHFWHFIKKYQGERGAMNDILLSNDTHISCDMKSSWVETSKHVRLSSSMGTVLLTPRESPRYGVVLVPWAMYLSAAFHVMVTDHYNTIIFFLSIHADQVTVPEHFPKFLRVQHLTSMMMMNESSSQYIHYRKLSFIS